jgi:HAD superfamily hydrolase (TIGR01509 family)
MLDNVNAAIFDLDGTLVDSMDLWKNIDIKYLKKFGLSVPEGLNTAIQHLSFQEVALYFKKTFNISDSVEEIQKEWHAMAYDEYKNNIKLKNGVKEFLSFLKSKNIKMCIATSNTPKLVEAVLQNNNIYDYFESITTTSEVERDKSFPDIYLLAASRLNVSHKHCIVFEDILPAVLSAKSAEMKVIAVEDENAYQDKAELIKSSDIYIKDFNELITLFS